MTLLAYLTQWNSQEWCYFGSVDALDWELSANSVKLEEFHTEVYFNVL